MAEHRAWSDDLRAAAIGAVGGFVGALIAAAVALATLFAQINAERDNALRTERIAATSTYVTRALALEADLQTAVGWIDDYEKSKATQEPSRTRAMTQSIADGLEQLKDAKGPVQILALDDASTNAVIDAYGVAKGEIERDLIALGARSKLPFETDRIAGRLDGAQEARATFTKDANWLVRQ